MSTKFSVVIPYFKKKDSLARLIKSLTDQKYENFECLLIDDGSDLFESNEINKVKNDNKFSLFYKENEGVASTRNYGLERSTGDYVIFLDADDCIDINILNKVNSKILIGKYDIVHYKCNIIENLKLVKNGFRWKIYDRSFKDILKNWDIDIIVPIHSCVYKKSFLISNKIKFDSELVNKEDWDFLLNVFSKTPKVGNINEVGAYYYINSKNQRSRDIRTLEKGVYQVLNKWIEYYPKDVRYNFIYRSLSNFSLTYINKFSVGDAKFLISIIFKKIIMKIKCIL